MYEPLTRQQWLVYTAVTLACCLCLNRVFGVPWFYMYYLVTGILISGWVSYAAYLRSAGIPMFSRGRPRQQPPRQFSRAPRTIQTTPRSRMAKGKKGVIKKLSPFTPTYANAQQHSPPPLNAEEAALMRRLISLTHDTQTARRLALGVRSRHPGRSRVWQLEKAIADLERDRFR
ncbi:MAG: hypothetical protein IGR92_03330 [Leptolyngbyaceae cyanobacterium T60_A2020_046]|nr:hypothetical protein [Leptolyngbyaceae cyanobacterium T60_A2020_046]